MSRVVCLALIAAAACGLVATACGHPAAPAAAPGSTHVVAPVVDAPPAIVLPLDQDLPRLASRGVQLFADWARVMNAAAGDCAAATAGITELVRAYADVIAANAKVIRDGRTKDLKAALAPHDGEMDASAKAIAQSPTMTKCAQDRAFADAIDTLVAPP